MDAEDKKALGDRAREARKALPGRVLQQDIADRAGVSLGVISNLENGKTVPQPSHRRAIAAALEEDIFGEGVAQETWDSWSADTQAFASAVGLFLEGLPADKRAAMVARWMRDILEGRYESDGA